MRDRIAAIEQTQEHQQAVAHGGGDQDVFGFYREGGCIEAQVLSCARESSSGNQPYRLRRLGVADEEVLRAVRDAVLPRRRPHVPESPAAGRSGGAAARRVSGRAARPASRARARAAAGRQGRLVEMARGTRDRRSPSARGRDAAAASACSRSCSRSCTCARARSASSASTSRPSRAAPTVGSLVVFDEGRPDKDGYRRYRITRRAATTTSRRCGRCCAAACGAGARRRLPDLLVSTAGGPARDRARGAGASWRDGVDVVGARQDARRARRPASGDRAQRASASSCPGRINPVVLAAIRTRCSCCSGCATRRTASPSPTIAASRERLRSVLDDIPGVGRARRLALLRHFGRLPRVRAATAEELMGVPRDRA